MKQLFVLALLALGLTIVVPTALPAAGDPQGPPCANITNGDGGYSAGGVIEFTVFLQAPACSRFVTYSFFVTDTSGAAIPFTATPDSTPCTPETDGGCVDFVYTLPASSPSTVCIYATTDIHGHHLADRAPNLSDPTCTGTPSPSFSLAKGSGLAGSGFS